MKYHLLYILPLFLFSCTENGEKVTDQDPKVILITLDGYRWQELFSGVDSTLMVSDFNSEKEEIKRRFWNDDPAQRARLLNPFFIDVVGQQGILIGNRNAGSLVNCTNGMLFSYPGYNEILTGQADDERIDSNNKIPNPNVTVLEEVNTMEDYKGKVAAFGSWDVFPFIVNEERSGIPVNAGFEQSAGENLSEAEKYLNRIQPQTPSPWTTVRLDVFTHNYALEYMKRVQPKLMYIAYGETDDFAHGGDYDQYLYSALRTNEFIAELWDYVRNTEGYRENTTLIVTTDHGRGSMDAWRHHGSGTDGASEIWMGVIGPGIVSSDLQGQFYQNQVADMIREIVGIEGTNSILSSFQSNN